MRVKFFRNKQGKGLGGIGKRLLIWFLILSLVPVLTVGVANYLISKNQLTNIVQEELLKTAQMTSGAIDHWLKEKVNRMEALAKFPAFQSGDQEQIMSALKSAAAQAPEAEMILWADPDGYTLTSLGSTTNISDRDYFKQALSGKVAVSDMLVSKVTQEKLIVVAAPVKGPGGTEGIVAGTFTAHTLTNLVSAAKFGQTGYGYMIDSTGVVMAHPQEDKILNENMTQTESETFKLVVQKMIQGQEGVDEYFYEGVYKLVAYSPVKASGWSVAVAAPTEEVFAGTVQIFRLTMLLILVVAAVVAFTAILLSRQISRPLVELTKQADVMATGNLNVDFATNYHGELGILGNALKNMLANTKAVLGSVNGAITNLDTAIQEISQAAASTSEASEQVAESINQVSAGSQEMANNSSNISSAAEASAEQLEALAQNIEAITRSTDETAKRTADGEKTMNLLAEKIKGATAKSKMVEQAMEELTEQAKQIGGVTDVITGIAEQTNLLALNAAIEAARAGDAGRGFAVVAEEVRKLAEESNQRANEIAQLIKQVEENIEKSTKFTGETIQFIEEQSGIGEEALKQFAEIAAGARKVAELLQEVDGQAKVVMEQGQKVSQEIGNIAAVSEENAASAEEIAASTEEMSSAAQSISASAQELITLVEKLKKESARFTF